MPTGINEIYFFPLSPDIINRVGIGLFLKFHHLVFCFLHYPKNKFSQIMKK